LRTWKILRKKRRRQDRWAGKGRRSNPAVEGQSWKKEKGLSLKNAGSIGSKLVKSLLSHKKTLREFGVYDKSREGGDKLGDKPRRKK